VLGFLDSLLVLVAVCLAVATACSYVNEQAAAVLRWRGQTVVAELTCCKWL
jgi:hypothetical protein